MTPNTYTPLVVVRVFPILSSCAVLSLLVVLCVDFLSFAKFVKQLNLRLVKDCISIMPKEIINLNIERPNSSVSWGFVIIGGKDQSLTVKVGKVKPFSLAEKAGLKQCDYIWQINNKEVFEMSHNQCVDLIKNSATQLQLNIER